MNSRCVGMLFLFIFLVACSNSRTPEHFISGNSDTAKIYDGTLVAGENAIAHSTVQISIDSFKYRCTGSVLSPTVILTAAHCVVDDGKDVASPLVFPSNGIQIEDVQNPAKYVNATKILVHPKFLAHGTRSTRNFFARGYDLALIQLASPLSDYYNPVEITPDLKALTKEKISIAGFGDDTVDPQAKSQPGLRSGPIHIDPKQKGLYRATEFKDDNGVPKDQNVLYFATSTAYAPVITFTRSTGTASICGGDSGGPLYFEKAGKIYLIGVNAATFDPSAPRKGACAENGINISVSLAGPALPFVLESFKELNQGVGLKKLSRVPPALDPNSFDFYLSKNTKEPFNTFLDLRGLTLKQDTDGLYDIESCANPSAEISLSKPAAINALDGQKIVTIYKYLNSYPAALFEARVLLEGGQARVVALTPNGYLSARIPVGACH